MLSTSWGLGALKAPHAGSGHGLAARALSTPSQEQGSQGELEHVQTQVLGTCMGTGWVWDRLLVHGLRSRSGLVIGTRVRHGPVMTTWVPSGPLLATCSLHARLPVTDREVAGFPDFRLKEDRDQSLARPVLHYILSKLSAGCGSGSNFPAIFPVADWSALNVSFVLL